MPITQQMLLVNTRGCLYKVANISTGNIFKCIFLNENVGIVIKISLSFVPRGLIFSKSELDSGNGQWPLLLIWFNFNPSMDK